MYNRLCIYCAIDDVDIEMEHEQKLDQWFMQIYIRDMRAGSVAVELKYKIIKVIALESSRCESDCSAN